MLKWLEQCALLLNENTVGMNRVQHFFKFYFYLPHYWFDKGFNGIVLNRAYPSFDEGPLEISVPVAFNDGHKNPTDKGFLTQSGWIKFKNTILNMKII